MTKDADQPYENAFRAMITKDPRIRMYREPGLEFLYRPGQLLVAPRDLDRVVARLREGRYEVTRGQPFAGVERLLLGDQVDIPRVVAELRDPRRGKPGERVPAVQPHHVVIGFGNIMGNPNGGPVTAAGLPDPDPGRLADGAGVTVGVCDTGIWRDAGACHPAWLGGSYTIQADDDDPLYAHDDVLDLQGGHGTFVAGVLRQAAPGVRFDPEVACSQAGVGDEESLAAALAGLDPKTAIVNLSLGCFTQDDIAPMPMVSALAALGRDVVVVAAAGNAGTSRPAWPAALDQVVAVAAVTETEAGVAPAGYSNFGPWVDACAPGEHVSTYVKGRWELPGAAPVGFGGFARWAGTSFAAPYVAGHLATVMTRHGITADQARLDLLGRPRWHPDYGVLVR
ncbi:S8 family peptidase [Planosporangium sp. 12N6]|uniref:S8 family peptidase n=1 Tax=Planosporangium spinosum TaxID=3402278 RepID=UPI003CEEEB69